jgi:hypothetical protein
LKENIVICFVPPGCTDAVQAIDAGISQLIQIDIGHQLDLWLEVDGNLKKWENGLKAKERRILMQVFREDWNAHQAKGLPG